MRRTFGALLALLAAWMALPAGRADALGVCTEGSDCLCDLYTPSAGSLLHCEDFEISTLRDARGAGAQGQTGGSCNRDDPSSNCYGQGAPTYGPAYDVTGSGSGTGRGTNWYWTKVYGAVDFNCDFHDGEPASPTLGVTCGVSECYLGEWRADDAWQSNFRPACVDIWSAGEWDDEVSALPELDPLDGDASMALRLDTTSGQPAGFVGGRSFSEQADLAGAFLTAFSGNYFDAGNPASNGPVKGDEWSQATDADPDTNGNATLMWPFGMTHDGCDTSEKPFCPVWFILPAKRSTAEGGDNTCVGTAAAATATVGAVTCKAAYRFEPGQRGGQTAGKTFARTTDFALDAVHYVGWSIQGAGTSSTRMRIWLDGNSDSDLILDISGLDTTVTFGGAEGIVSWSWNSFSNWKQSNGTSSAVRRGYDNWIVVTGTVPPTPAEVGFGAAPPADISIGTPVLTLDPVTGYAPVSVDASVPFSDAGGTVALWVDCAGGTSWVDTGVSGTVSPLSAPDVCSYATQVGAPTAIAFRVVDGDGSDDDSDTAAISIAENPAKWAEGAITSLTGFYVDSPFLSYDSNRIYFLASPKAVTDYFAGTSTLPQWPALPGHQGDTDLYYVEWDGSAWGAPVNLGTEINTSDSECCMWVNEAETQIIFWRTGALTGATNLVATRASKADPWDTPSGMAGELGSVNQNPPTNYRTDINVDPATLDLYLWEHDSVTNGILQRAPWNGSGWDALVDLTALDDADDDDTQPVVSRDGLILLWNRRGSDAITELMRATRATTGDSWGTPASVTLNGFEDGASIQAWGELSFDGDEQGFVAVRFDTTVPGWAAHLIHVDGGAGASSYGPPVDLNDYVEPQKCTPENPCCCLATPP